MLQDLTRKKLLNAILYFSKSVNNPYKLKIFKLLFLLDFKHIKEKGYPVTNLDYYSWPLGPVPKDLFNELTSGVPEDFKDSLKIETISFNKDKEGFKFVPTKKPDLSVFTKREKRIMEELAYMYKDATAEQMTEITHLKNQPWDKTLKSKGENQLIDFMLAIDDESTLSVDDAKKELKQVLEMYSNHCV